MTTVQYAALSALIGLAVFIYGWSWLVTLSYKKSWLMFFITMCFPFIYPFFDWKRARFATIVTVGGLVVLIVGLIIVFQSPEMQEQLKNNTEQMQQLLNGQ